MTVDLNGQKLWQQALGLLLEASERPQNKAVRERIRRFRKQSPAHETAWREAEQIWRLTGQIPAPSSTGRSTFLTRRRLIAGLSTAAAAGVVGIVAPDIMRRISSDFVTGAAEIRTFVLPDNSTATLGPESALKLTYSQTDRRVELLDGMVYLNVVPEARQKFSAICGALTATAADASFDLSHDAGTTSVAADRGTVTTTIAGSEFVLNADDWLHIDQARKVSRGRQGDEYRAAWRQGLIVAEREPIRSVVARISRWYAGKVVIAPGLGDRRVSGIFDLRNPVAALEAVVAPFDGKVHQLTSWLVIVSPV